MSSTKKQSIFLGIFSDLQDTRGKSAAQHYAVLARCYSGKKKRVRAEVLDDCKMILAHQPTDRNQKYLICAFALLFTFIAALVGLSVFGHSVPKDDRGLVGILVSLLCGVATLFGSNTAKVDAILPAGKGKKITIKLLGVAAGIVGPAYLMHLIGY